jgi:hypothetical protein
MREIPITKGYVALVDDDDFDLVNRFKWRAHLLKGGKHVYAERWEYFPDRRRRVVYMHRQILGSIPQTNVFHLDGDGLNNTRRNLVPGVNFHESYVINPANGCWVWCRALTDDGFGEVTYLGRNEFSHRLSYILHNHCEVPAGMVVRHSCNAPACVNPDHLFLATRSECSAERAAKGRGYRGGTAKLTAERVLAIRTDTRPHRLIADDHGISRSWVSNIKAGKGWREVSP